MRKINLPLITDTLFTAVIAFALFFTAIRHYTKSAAWGVCFGIAAALLFGALAFLYISGKQRKKLLLADDEKKKNALLLHLSLSPESEAEELIKKLYGAEGERRPENDDCVYFPFFKMSPLDEDDVAKAVKLKTDKRKVILCNRVCEGAKALAEAFLIETVTADELYLKVKENNLLPEKFVYEEKKKPKGWKRIKSRFTKKLFRPLFISGISLTLFSFVTSLPVYYIVVGGILLILSAAALLFGKA